MLIKWWVESEAFKAFLFHLASLPLLAALLAIYPGSQSSSCNANACLATGPLKIF